MTWQPPPSFTETQASSRSSTVDQPPAPYNQQQGKQNQLVPTWTSSPGGMLMGNDHSPSNDLASVTMSLDGSHGGTSTTSHGHRSYGGGQHHPTGLIDSPSAKIRRNTRSKNTSWNQTLFVVSPQAVQGAESNAAENHNNHDVTDVSEIQNRSLTLRSSNNDESVASKKEHFVFDHSMLRTRLEWTQLLVSRLFKPYRYMICALDDDLPNPDDMDTIEEVSSNDDYLMEGNNELIKIRDEMMDDPNLSEREIAAFFEGCKLFQMKLTSLETQLNALKAMRKMSFHASLTGTQLFSGERHPPATISFITNPTYHNADASLHWARENVRMTSLLPMQKLPSVDEDDMEPMMSDHVPFEDPLFQNENEHSPHTLIRSIDDGNVHEPPDHVILRPQQVDHKSRSLRQMSIQRIRETCTEKGHSEDIKKLLEELEEAERRQRKLEKQLAQSGIIIAEDISYNVAKEKVERIAQRMAEIGGSDAEDRKLQEEYYVLEREMDKYMAALQLSDEWTAEQALLERQWEESVAFPNQEALKKLRRHMPVDVRNRSEVGLTVEPSPNGKHLPSNIAKKFKRTNVLQLLRIDPDDIVPMHAATLENLRVTGLTLTERRALHHHLKDVANRWKATPGDKMTERKWSWFNMMKTNFKEHLDVWQRHVDQYGSPINHRYATRDNPYEGCPLIGNQCPFKADKVIDYDGDYGFPEGPIYFNFDVNKFDIDHTSKVKQEAQDALKQKKAEERSKALKAHYHGKLLEQSLANGSCEAMDEAMESMEDTQEKWIRSMLTKQNPHSEDSKRQEVLHFNDALNDLKLSILQFAERSGMQLTGKRDANADHPDQRSIIELSLCEEVVETAFDFFRCIEDRMSIINMTDGKMKITIQQLKTLLEELHERNLQSIGALGEERPPRSRPLKSNSSIMRTLAKKLEKEEKLRSSLERVLDGSSSNSAEQRFLPKGHDRGNLGGLLAAIATRGNR